MSSCVEHDELQPDCEACFFQWIAELKLKASAARLGREGGTLKRVLPDGGVETFTIIPDGTWESA